MSESIANRLGLLESKLNWLMGTMRMKAAIQSGVLDANGQPAVTFVDGNMHEMYDLAQKVPTEAIDGSALERLMDAAKAEAETQNG